MCLVRTTKPPRPSTKEWTVAYKAVRELASGEYEPPLYWFNTSYPFLKGIVNTDTDYCRVQTLDRAETYPSGFHCYRRRKDAELWKELQSGLKLVVLRVYVRNVVSTGRDCYSHRVVVARDLYIPAGKGDRPPNA